MKAKLFRLSGVLFFFMIALAASAQVPQSFNYQAVARNATGDLLQNQPVGIRLSVHEGSAGGTVVYQETHLPTTNQFGLINLAVGAGSVVSGDFTTINWSSGLYWLEVEMDPAGGSSYAAMGNTQLLTVPFAMYAQNAGIKGDSNYIPKFGAAGGLKLSSIYEDKSGWIGLGNINPAVKLHINGHFRVDAVDPLVQFFNGSNYGAFLQSYGANSDFYIANMSATGDMIFWMNGGTEVMRILPSNFIGININNPSAMLHIKGKNNNYNDGIRLEDDGSTEYGDIMCGQEGLFYFSRSTGNDHIFYTASNSSLASPPLIIKDNGNIGMGYGSPTNKLEVNNGGSNNYKFRVTNFGGYTGFGQELGSAQPGYFLGHGGSYWHFMYAATPSSSYTPMVSLDGSNNSFRPTYDNTVGLGSASAKWTAVYAVNGTIQTSDENYKTNIKDLNYGLAEVMQLRPVSFTWKDSKTIIGTGNNLGFIAQDLEKVVPDVVVKSQTEMNLETGTPMNSFSETYGVKYSELIPVLVKAIQEQQAEIEQLKQQIKQLQGK